MTPLLELEAVGVRFGGAAALSGINLALRPGECLGLIGPNGAGKTTLFNVITGFVPVAEGRLRFAGQPLAGLSPAGRVRAGLVRSFQRPMLFPQLTLRQNLGIAARQRAGAGLAWRRPADDAAERLAGQGGLFDRLDTPVQRMSHGEQRIADVLLALALAPRLLLLDEPTAGLTGPEAGRLLDLVRSVPGLTVMLVAHDVDVVFGRCDRVAVLNLGRLVCCGTPAAVRADAGAQASYLGTLAAA